MPLPAGLRALLLDIEGTTTPISFVYERLFPFARTRLEETCRDPEPGSAVAVAIDRLRDEYEVERSAGAADLPEFDSGAAYAEYLMDEDRKSTGLKQLQGLIWEEGFRSGALHGKVFADVPKALETWSRAGLAIKIYSSGSVQAQRLLFGFSTAGDLTQYLSGYYDTTTGSKLEAESYRTIAAESGLAGAQILFLSDVVAELDAAAEAGLVTGLMTRPGNPPVGDHDYPVYSSFAELI